MNFDSMLQDVITIYQSSRGAKLTEETAKHIIRALLSVRDTERIMQSSPRHLFQNVFENDNFYNKISYPCDIIELRGILSANKVTQLSKIIMFSNAAADRVLKDQKARLILNVSPEKLAELNNCEVSVFGGMAIFDANILDIKNLVSSIVIDAIDYKAVACAEAITKEFCPTCPVYTTSFIPGIDKFKFARDVMLFEVNLPTLGIHKEKCRAVDALQALKEVLAIRWDKHPDRNIYRRRPENYTAEFWANSGFFDSIVRQIGGHKKAAQVTPQAPKIQLTPQEQQIFATLLDINQKMGLGITFRVAGGWVRDKLLGTPSDDIDIALDKMTGQQFVTKALEYHRANPNSPIDADSNYVVQSNPDKSKHLETTALDIAGLKIDFVNLRDESYGDSRIPTMTMASDPKVDAQRRDLTINALFYNVNNQQVEDYVGGLQDLQSMTLRTPLDPTKTFMDDPLRMLRVFRFFSRYPNAKIADDTMNAMKDPKVHDAFRQKVSPERSGPEIIKMFGAARPAEAIRALFTAGLDKAVFNAPEFSNLHPLTMDQKNKHHKFNLMEHTLRVVENLDRIMKEKKVNGKDRILMLMAAVFHDYGKAHPEIGKPKEKDPTEYTYVGHEDKSADIAEAILKRIGIGDEDRKFVNMVVRQHMRPHTEEWSNKSMGRFMRDTMIPGQDRDDIWNFVMMHAQADTMAKSDEGDQADYDLKEQHIQQMQEYRNRPVPIQNKPLIDGLVLQQMFPNIPAKPPKGGVSFIKYIQNKLMDEQFAGNISTPEQATQYVQSIRGEVEAMYSQGKQANNWYDKAKVADASSGSAFGTGGRLPSEGPVSEMTGVKRMVYREQGSPSMVAVGDSYRSKAVGVAFEASKDKVYKVVSKSNGYVVLQDGKGEKQEIEIGVELPAKFVKV